MTKFIQVFTTTDSKPSAEKIAESLVEKKLAACVQIIGPINSTYRWQGKIEKSQEWLCLIKTKESLFIEVEKAIKEIHPYETPEIVAIPLMATSKEYLSWLEESF